MAEAAAHVSLGVAARTLAASSNQETSSWLVGTNSLRERNEVLLLQHDSENGALRVTRASHPAEVWALAAHSADRSLLAAAGPAAAGAALYRLHPVSGELQQQGGLAGHAGAVRQLRWHPAPALALLLSLEARCVQLWALREAGAERVGAPLQGAFSQLSCAAWDPSSSHGLATAEGGALSLWDTRAPHSQPAQSWGGAHQLPVRCLEYVPQQERLLASGGDDGRVRLWDLRAGPGAHPLLDLAAHRHWVWALTFNPAHSNLLLTGSSDTTAALWHINYAAAAVAAAELSSSSGGRPPSPSKPPSSKSAGGGSTASSGAPSAIQLRASPGRPMPPSGRVQTHSDQAAGVYGCAWSGADPFVYATLAGDGQFVVRQVPTSMRRRLIAQ